MKINIFYSWQSTTDATYNRNFIKSSIEKAIKKVKNKPETKGIEFQIIDSVRGLPGTPAVADNIFERIKDCEIFIADLSVVNKQSGLEKFASFISKKNFKPFQNNNVLLEYGVAQGKLGLERIICVLNSHYGSPNDNPENIPFDVRHLRFPIEYKYSNIKDKEKVQEQLVNDLATAIRDSTRYIVKNLKEKYLPFITWKSWNSIFDQSQKFYANQFIDNLTLQILKSISSNKNTLRIVGLSGIGKSRILLEIFRPKDNDTASILLSSRVLYYDFQDKSNIELTVFINKLQENDEDKILILDNCDLSQHMQLLKYFNNSTNKISLISVDSNPEEFENPTQNINYLYIKKDDLEDVVNKIIDEDFSYLQEEDTKRIKEFSQGIPLMATLLSESAKENEGSIGKINDQHLISKLLGDKGRDDTNRRILRSCSLFNYIGYEDGAFDQLKFIATNKNITSLNLQNEVIIDRFLETCNHFLKREIFEKRGRFILMRPFPLAMYLACEWLETCTAEKMENIINNIAEINNIDHKNSISDSFAKQMRYLNYNDRAVEITEKLVGTFGPFHNAKVLNTELGSRLFRSFVEVNPIATSRTLWDIFGIQSNENLIEIVDGRRNLVWSLEKLCFDKRTFEESGKVLFLFALAENESWSNNATGEFIHLFKILLPGTEADLEQRFNLLKWCFTNNREGAEDLALSCIRSALDATHFSRMMGAEEQGLKKLKDYKPESYIEIHIYWEKTLNLLLPSITNNNTIADKCIDIILSSMRSITKYQGFNLLEKYLSKIFEAKEWKLANAVKPLKQLKKFNKNDLEEEQLAQIDSFINKLSEDSFYFRFTRGAEFLHLDLEDYSYEKEVEYFGNLAKEFINDKHSWDEFFPIIFNLKSRFNFTFGMHFNAILKEDKEKSVKFINKAFEALESIPDEERNFNVLAGFVYNFDDDEKSEFYKKIFNNHTLQNSLFYFLSSDEKGKDYFHYLYDLLDKGANINLLYNYNFRSLLNANAKEKLDFYNNIAKRDDKSYAFILESAFNITYDSSLDYELKNYLIEIFYKFYPKLDFSNYKISHLVIKILKQAKEKEFAKFINRSIIIGISWENSHAIDGEVQRIYEVLISDYFNDIWQELSVYLLSEDVEYIRFFGLKNILGSSINSSVRAGIGLLFKGDIDKIFNWAKKYPDLAPERLAQLIPIFAGNNDKFDELHPIAIRLLNEFGNCKNVLDSFGANMGTFSWIGSAVPILKSKKEVFKSLKNHNIPEIREWANYRYSIIDKEIQYEEKRDEERFL